MGQSTLTHSICNFPKADPSHCMHCEHNLLASSSRGRNVFRSESLIPCALESSAHPRQSAFAVVGPAGAEGKSILQPKHHFATTPQRALGVLESKYRSCQNIGNVVKHTLGRPESTLLGILIYMQIEQPVIDDASSALSLPMSLSSAPTVYRN